NQERVLEPVPIGHHGETMRRLLKPGFHSGTLPRIHRKLRRAERRQDARAVRKQRRALEHVEESLRHFVERELLSLLAQSKSWGSQGLTVLGIAAGSNRVRLELRCPGLSETGLWILFEEQSGWLLGSIAKPGWLGQLPP